MKLSHHFLFNGKKVIDVLKKLQKYFQKQFAIETVIVKNKKPITNSIELVEMV